MSAADADTGQTLPVDHRGGRRRSLVAPGDSPSWPRLVGTRPPRPVADFYDLVVDRRRDPAGLGAAALRRFRGAAHRARSSAPHHRRPGRAEFADRELSRFPGRRFRRPADRTCTSASTSASAPRSITTRDVVTGLEVTGSCTHHARFADGRRASARTPSSWRPVSRTGSSGRRASPISPALGVFYGSALTEAPELRGARQRLYRRRRELGRTGSRVSRPKTARVR